MTNGLQDLTSNSTQGYPDAGFGLDLGSVYHFGQPLGQHQAYQTQQYQMPAQTDMEFHQTTGSSFSTNRTGSMASMTSALAPPYTPYASPVSYAPMINNGMTTHDFGNDGIMYGDQYISPMDYSSSNFLSGFNDPFSTAQKQGENGDYL
jgi:hypothetical protein